jgi:hypothetical protein
MSVGSYGSTAGMRLSAQVLADVCKRMIKVILYALPCATRGTVYSVGPMPDLRVVRVASGYRNGHVEDVIWGETTGSDYAPPGKVWEHYCDRPGAILEAMAWCVERQKSWTAEDPQHDVRSIRKQLQGKAGEDYHHMEPVLVSQSDVWDQPLPLDQYAKDSSGRPIWQESECATVAIIKIHFLPGSIKTGDRSTRVIKELSHSLGTQMLSLHARELALEKEKRLIDARQETCNVLSHEFRNLVSRLGFAYRALNSEISYLRELWENLVCQSFPEQPNKQALLLRLNEILEGLEAKSNAEDLSNEISKLRDVQGRLAHSCLLPRQNETWFLEKIQPLWATILARADVPIAEKNEIEKCLGDLRKSFHVGVDRALRDKMDVIPEELKTRWAELAYCEMSGGNGAVVDEYIELLNKLTLDVPRKRQSLNNLTCLKHLVELAPEIEKRLNGRLEDLKNNR